MFLKAFSFFVAYLRPVMTKEYDEKTCVCALNRLLGFEPAVSHNLIGSLGSAWSLFNLDEGQKLRLLGPFSKIAPLLNAKELERSEEELKRLQEDGCRFVTMAESGYPALLRECEDAPLGLYFKGSSPPEEVFNTREQIAVVGTRDVSLYGKEWCRRIVGAMACAQKKPLIVSGFALGTDITAHLAALEAGLPTVAVLPTGIDCVYPARHERCARTLCSTPGCALVTDYPPGTEPKAINFIRRNRIIAGICSGTILVESRLKGGGMITARLASSYDRDLLVLPGRVDDLRSQGCNALLREKLAEPITDTAHFLDILGLGAPERRKKAGLEDEVRSLYSTGMNGEEVGDLVAITGAVKKQRGITLDGLCHSLGIPYGKVSYYVGMLESDGIISTDLLQRCVINVKNV